MRLACLVHRRRLAPYLDGELGPGQAESLARHLAACPACSGLLSRLRAGREAARRFGRLGPAGPPILPSFEELRAGPPASGTRSPAVPVPALLTAAAGLLAIVVLAGRQAPPGEPGEAIGPAEITAAVAFAPLAIREFGTRPQTRVVTEGIVQDVYFDEQEQTLHIRLAEGPEASEPFVICEVRNARGLTIPAAGNRIRVYGRARFDAQPGRGWHEVNPVLEIAVLNRRP